MKVQDDDFIFSLVPRHSLSTDVYLIFFLIFIHQSLLLKSVKRQGEAVPTCNLLVTRYTSAFRTSLKLSITSYRSFGSINIAMVYALSSFKQFPVYQVLQTSKYAIQGLLCSRFCHSCGCSGCQRTIWAYHPPSFPWEPSSCRPW